MQSVLTLVETICRKMWARPLLKNAKRPLPVDVLRSKTSLLKLTNILEHEKLPVVYLLLITFSTGFGNG